MPYTYDGANQPDYDGADDGSPEYMSAGVPSADLMAEWLANALEMRPTGFNLSALAAKAAADFETASAGTALEATLGLLSSVLHHRLEQMDTYPRNLPEQCPGCDDPNNVYAYLRNEMTGRCYDAGDGREVFTCQRCGFDLTPHLGPAYMPVEEDCDPSEDDDLPY